MKTRVAKGKHELAPAQKKARRELHKNLEIVVATPEDVQRNPMRDDYGFYTPQRAKTSIILHARDKRTREVIGYLTRPPVGIERFGKRATADAASVYVRKEYARMGVGKRLYAASMRGAIASADTGIAKVISFNSQPLTRGGRKLVRKLGFRKNKNGIADHMYYKEVRLPPEGLANRDEQRKKAFRKKPRELQIAQAFKSRMT